MKILYGSAFAVLIATVVGANAAPDPKETIPQSQIASLLPEAEQLSQSLAKAIQGAQATAGAQGLSKSNTQAAIQAAIQNVIIQSGFDPRAVLAALRAVQYCSTAASGDYTGSPLGVACSELRQGLSLEALQAIASLQTVVVGLIDNNNTAPAALGALGSAAQGATFAVGGGGGASGYID